MNLISGRSIASTAARLRVFTSQHFDSNRIESGEVFIADPQEDRLDSLSMDVDLGVVDRPFSAVLVTDSIAIDGIPIPARILTSEVATDAFDAIACDFEPGQLVES